MSRFAGEQVIAIAPRNNVYTVLAAAAVVIELLGLLVLITRAKEIMPPGIL